MHSDKIGRSNGPFIRNVDEVGDATGSSQQPSSGPVAPADVSQLTTNVPGTRRDDPTSPHTALRPGSSDSRFDPVVTATARMATEWGDLSPAVQELFRKLDKPPDEHLLDHGNRWLSAAWPTQEELMAWIG